MPKRINLTAGILALFVFFCQADIAWESGQSTGDPTTLDEYHFVARGKMSRDRDLNPQRIAGMDNNGRILISCLEAKTAEQLQASGISCLRSQLELLADWKLLEYDRKEKTYRTTIHVYGTERAAAIRQKVGVTVEQLAEELRADLDSLRSHLEGIDSRKSIFAILYAYVLHSYAMEQFGDEIYRKPQLSAESPFWNGYAWAIFPKRRFPVGVSVMPVDDTRVFRIAAVALEAPDFQQFMPLVEDVVADSRADDPDVLKSFSQFALFDEEGRLTVPVFEGEWPKKLEDMARNVYVKTIELVDSQEMKEILGMATQAQAAMFIHYEVRYAFLRHLLDKGTIEAPIDFEDAGNNGPADLRYLVFLIKTVPPGPSFP
jgi:hypothetical protein